MKKTIRIEEDIFDANDSLAIENRRLLDQNNVFGINIMASPGAGKTSLILSLVRHLLPQYRIGVIEGDVVLIDVEKIATLNIPVILANTGGSCHLDAVMVAHALQKLPLPLLNLVLVENVGNLICPANFALGTHLNLVIASVPEGDDKPYKYPGMFQGADMVIINKIDYLERENFDFARFEQGVRRVNPDAMIFPLSCKTNERLQPFFSAVEEYLKIKVPGTDGRHRINRE